MCASKCAAVICLPCLYEEQRRPSDDCFLDRALSVRVTGRRAARDGERRAGYRAEPGRRRCLAWRT